MDIEGTAPEATSVSETVSTPSGSTSEAVSTSEEGHVSQPTETVSEATTPAETTTPEFSLSTYDWDSWDGKMESFPEDVRGPLNHIYERGKGAGTGDWEEKYNEANEGLTTSKEEVEALRAVYNAISLGQEDPRLETLTTERDQLRTQLEESQGQYNAYQKQVTEASKAEARSWADSFRAKHKDIFSDKAKADEYQKLVQEEGWDFEPAVALMGMDEKGRAAAQEAKANGASDAFAIKFAETLAAKPSPVAAAHPPPRAGANITHGAKRVSQGESVQDPQVKMTNINDMTRWAARKALTKNSRR